MKKRKNNRGQMDTSFAWIFAIIVGAVILFLAIYGVSKFMNLAGTEQSAESAKQIDILLNPLESGYETGQKVVIYAPVETRIFSYCTLDDEFGKQKIQTLQNTYNKWTPTGVNITSRNKYIFTENPSEGKKFTVFSKQYEFPSENSYDFAFKVADLIYIIPYDKKYCFSDAPDEIKTEIKNLNAENLLAENCPEESRGICYNNEGADCYMEVDYNNGIGVVEKNSKEMHFNNDASMYAAIFSDYGLYECQMGRVMKRAEQLVAIYEEKSQLEKTQGCNSEMESDLFVFENILKNYENSENLYIVTNAAKQLNKQNGRAGECKLW